MASTIERLKKLAVALDRRLAKVDPKDVARAYMEVKAADVLALCNNADPQNADDHDKLAEIHLGSLKPDARRYVNVTVAALKLLFAMQRDAAPKAAKAPKPKEEKPSK